MGIYNQNDEFLKYDLEFINGYLTSIALLRDYITNEVGFNFYFKKIGTDKSVNQAINDELVWALERYVGINEIGQFDTKSNNLIQLDNWQRELTTLLDFWIGEGLTNAIKEENRNWRNGQQLILKDLVAHLKRFFQNKSIEVFVFNKEFANTLPFQWGWLRFDDIIFRDSTETYLLHFDLSD